MKTEINPLYAYVADLLNLGKTYLLDIKENVIKKDGKWKVCKGFFKIAL